MRKHLYKNDFDLRAPVAKTTGQMDVIRIAYEMEAIRSSHLRALLPERSDKGLSDALTRMHSHGLLSKPPEQTKGGVNKYHPHIYSAADRGIDMLESTGGAFRYVKTSRPRGSEGYRIEWTHTLGISDTIANIRIGALQTPCSVVSQEEIEYRHHGHVLDYPLHLTALVEGRQVRAIPDAVFGITYPNQKTSFYALEYQNTGATKKNDLRRSSMFKKMLAYDEAIKRRSYKSEWGVPNLRAVLYVFADAARYREALNLARKEFPGAKHFWFYHQPNHRLSPQEYILAPLPRPEMLTDPWQRADLPDATLYDPENLPG